MSSNSSLHGSGVGRAILSVLAATALAFVIGMVYSSGTPGFSSCQKKISRVPVDGCCYYAPDKYIYSPGDTFFFGEYEQDNNLSSGDEQIMWRILQVDNDRILAISDKILDVRQFHRNDAHGSDWQSCDLRKWLNDSFYSSAFNDEEKLQVIMSINPSYKNPDFPDVTGPETSDYVFLLSIREVEEYIRHADVTMLAEPTEYAKSKFASAKSSAMVPAPEITDYDARRPWWLRTNGRAYWLASIILESDEIAYRGRVVTAEDIGVRPVICLEYQGDSETKS